jgi:hypothetical protein
MMKKMLTSKQITRTAKDEKALQAMVPGMDIAGRQIHIGAIGKGKMRKIMGFRISPRRSVELSRFQTSF